MRNSVRLRITIVAALAVAIVLSVTSVALVAAQRRQLVANLDSILTQRLEAVASSLGPDFPGLVSSIPEVDDLIGQIIVDGTVVDSSQNLDGVAPLLDLVGAGPEFFTADRLVGDDAFRVTARRIQDRVIVVGANTDEVEDAAQVLVALLAFGTPTVVIVLAGIVWWLVGRTLAPVELIRSRVDSIGGSLTDQRVPVPAANDEISRLAVTMNEMLDRIERSGTRQRQFVADASHELRSPLTRLRAAVEVELASPRAGGDQLVLRSVIGEIDELQSLLADLLTLARLDADHEPSAERELDLDDLVRRAIERTVVPETVSLTLGAIEPLMVNGEPIELTRAIGNVLDNAVRHARASVVVGLARATDSTGTAEVTVTDDGPGIPPEHHASVFERFTRLDEARERHGGGSGLGLAIAKEIMERWGGTITVDPETADGTKVVMHLPIVS